MERQRFPPRPRYRFGFFLAPSQGARSGVSRKKLQSETVDRRQYVRYSLRSEEITSQGTISGGCRGLRGTISESDIDAAVNKSGSSSEVFLFKGDKYVRYHVGQEKIMSGPRSIVGGWEGLTGTTFTSNLNVAS